MRSQLSRRQLGRGALEFAILIVFTVAVYTAFVFGAGTALGTGGEPNIALAVVATSVIAVALAPVRSAARRLSARLAYGEHPDPYEVLAEAARQAGAMLTSDDALFRMAQVVARGTGAERVELWLRDDHRLRLEAAWPEGDELGAERPLPPHGVPDFLDATRSAPVIHQGEVLGAIAVHTPEGRPLGEVEESLLETLASQAALALRNASLTRELQRRVERIEEQARALAESRRRIIGAQDEERRRLQRTIHDGPQQHLVSIVVKLRLAKGVAGSRPDEARGLLEEVRGDVDDALSALRELARGIHPPVLSDRGIAAAIESYAARLPIEVSVEDRTGGKRFDARLEATAYFCTAEALRHALAPATVVLDEDGAELSFTITHGHAVDADVVRHLQDRVASFDGSLQVAPGTVAGRVPTSVRETPA